jgi:DinB superfamily
MEQDTLTMKTPEGVTHAEREHMTNYLAAVSDRLMEASKGLSEAQWNFRPGRDRWSIAETMDHLATIEDRVHDILGQMAAAPADTGRDVKRMDAYLQVAIPMRHPKITAPARVAPAGGRTGAEALEHLLAKRKRLAEMLASAPNLRGHVVPHPIFGPLDGYQWIVAAGCHSARHTDQILEIRSDAQFPAA